ncbi:MAG TPA: hypothetical protein VJ963_06840 [Bacteroidales bacterium]|nr:hypothetical protein [Bacteroidales bacterium]
MKRIIIISLILLTFPVLKINAQNSNLEKLNAFKIGFFTRRLDLSTTEAEKFWPAYNEYQDKRNTLLLEKASIIRNYSRNKNNLTEKQTTEMGDRIMGLISDESTLSVNFHKTLKDILPPGKVILFYQVENQYKAALLNELQNNRQQRGGAREF